MSQILVIGSLNIDLVVKTRRIPRRGETVTGADVQTFPGGKGANQAVAVSRLGGEAVMVGRIGDDHHGLSLRDNLHAAGVDVSRVQRTPGTPTGAAFIVVEETGQNIIVVSPGANRKLTPEDVLASEDLIGRADLLLLQLESPLETVLAAVEAAGRGHTRVILNPAPARDLPRDLFSKIDFLIPNETEASLLAGVEVHDPGTAEAAAGRLRDLGARAVIITLGSEGALMLERGPAVHVPARPVKAVDATAAGDAFVGGLAVGLSRSLPLREAVDLAGACGALAVTRLGAQASLPHADEVRDFMKTESHDRR